MKKKKKDENKKRGIRRMKTKGKDENEKEELGK